MVFTRDELELLHVNGYSNIRPYPESQRPHFIQRFHEMAQKAGIRDAELYSI